METLKELIESFQKKEDLAVIEITPYRKFQYSYHDLYGRALRFANLLKNNGLKKGDKILLWCYNGMDWATILSGAILSGIILVPVDLRATQEFAQSIQQYSGARFCFQTRYKPKLQNVRTFFIEDLDLEMVKPEKLNVKIKKEDIVELVYTSGTTGDPKGVMLTHENMLVNILGLQQVQTIHSQYKFLSLLPLSHMFEQSVGFFLPISRGAKLVYLRTLKASTILQTFKEEKIAVALLVPALLKIFQASILQKAKEQKKEKIFTFFFSLATTCPFLRKMLFHKVRKAFGNLQYFVCGGATLDLELERFFVTLGIPILQGYGLTETSPVITANALGTEKLGSVGKALPDVKIKISQDGEILVQGKNCTQGYYNSPEKTSALFQGRWLKTGDLGFLDDENYLFLKGRKKEMIKTAAGLPVYPDDIEAVLNKIPGVKDSAVLGILSEKGEKVHAALLLEKDADPAKVIKEANKHLAEHQQVASYDVWPYEDFPRTSTLKVKKFEVLSAIQKKQKPAAIVDKHNKLYNILAELTEQEISEEKTLEVLGLTSIDRLELVSLLEQEFNLDIDEDKILPRLKVKELESMIQKKRLLAEKKIYRKWPLAVPANMIRIMAQKLLLFLIVKLFSKPKVKGLENLKTPKTPVIFAVNHQSHLDTPLVLMHIPLNLRKRTAVAAWQEYFFTEDLKFKSLRNRFLFFFASLFFNIYPFPQSKEFKKAIQYTGKLISENWNILIFPEGTRSMSNTLLPLKQGIGILAVEMKIPIIPIRLRNVHSILPKDKNFPKLGHAEISIGKPLLLKNRSYLEATEEIEAALKKL